MMPGTPAMHRIGGSELDLSNNVLDEHINSMRTELGDDFEHMVTYLKKMETTVV